MSTELSPGNVNTPAFWEDYFSGQWEKNSGRTQTRLFAEYFVNKVAFPADAKTLLDVGCGMGDAMPVFHARYPHLQLTGCDVSATAISKAREAYGAIAAFEMWAFDEIPRAFDIIYVSNVLEHFEAYLSIAEGLLSRCRRLYVAVPYMELRENRRLCVESGQQHVVTFDRRSFDRLLEFGKARAIRSRVVRTPGAWGMPRRPPLQVVKDWVRGRKPPTKYRQVFFEIDAR